MIVRKRVLVSGRVQGVFFRDTCSRKARAEGLAGRVANLPDGRVEAVFEGDEGAVDRMIEWCREGPPHARVEDIEAHDEDPAGETGFSVS